MLSPLFKTSIAGVLSIATVLAPVTLAAATGTASSASVSTRSFLNDVQKSIAATPELAKSKDKIEVAIAAIRKNGVYSLTGGDAEKRAVMVGLQSAIEHVLNLRQKSDPKAKLLLVYHTPAPATPLCSPVDTVAEGLVDPKIKDSKEVQYTVASRTQTVRDLIAAGAQTYVVFQKDGLSQRSPEQQKIYSAVEAKYKGRLWSKELSVAKLSNDMVGATYLFTDGQGEKWIFFIQATQANSPSDPASTWQIGFAPASNAAVRARADAVMAYLAISGQPAIKAAFQ